MWTCEGLKIAAHKLLLHPQYVDTYTLVCSMGTCEELEDAARKLFHCLH